MNVVTVFLMGAAVSACAALVFVRLYGAKIRDEFHRKIAEQKSEIDRQMRLLADRSAAIETVMSNMREGLILIDAQGKVLTANRSAHDIFGEAQMVERGILHICRDVDFQEKINDCLAGKFAELVFHRNRRVYNEYFSPVYVGEKVTGAVILFFDATAIYAAQKQQREFSANVSHELKTPLTTICGYAELLEKGMVKPGDEATVAAKITVQSQRMISLIEDIIRLSELDETATRIEKERFNLRQLCEAVLAVLSAKAHARNVTLSLQAENFEITANKRMIDELLYNLVDNGISYNKNGGSVDVTASLENGRCEITISDTGIGIPQEHADRVFERFFTVDPSHSKKTGGTGLGLAIVKNIAERHDGNVRLESAAGGGASFVCDIAAQ